MGDEEEAKTSRQPDIPITQLEDRLWKIVTEGKLKNLQGYVEEFKTHPKFKAALNSVDYELDEDGGNVVIYCVKVGRDKGSSFGGKDPGSCLTLLVENGADIDHVDKANRTALSWAVFLRYPNSVNRLLKLGADVKIADQDGHNPFQIAVQSGSKDIVASIIDHDNKVIDLADQHGVPPLVTAVKHKQIDVCRLLLDKGANINGLEQKQKRTAVYYAIKYKLPDMLDLLLKHKPRLDTIDCKGRSILYLCCELSDTRYFQKVINYCPKFSQTIMDQPADEEKTPVIVACQNGNSEQLKHLLENGASVKAHDTSGKTALHHCADNLETQCAEMLLDNDKSILEVKDEQGYTALALAVLVGNVNLIKLLLEKGANIGTEDNEGHKLSHWAAVCGHLKALDILVNNNAQMSSPDNHHAYPIHYAAQMNGANSGNTESRISEKVLKKFIDCKVDLDVLDDAGRQPLLWAACSGNADSCRMLLKAGADINSTDQDDLTALHCAASRGHHDCIEVLRKGGADVNMIDKNKCTPLFYAITLGNKSCTQALIKAKSNVNHVDDRGRNPVHCAAIKGCLDTLKLLEKEKADLWHQNNKGDYPIHEAAQKGHSDIVKYFLHQKNDREAVNVTNKVGKTLLHIAAATNNLPLCKLLINADGDKNALMKHAGKDFTPYDLAVVKGYHEAADYLKQKGALPNADVTNIEKGDTKEKKGTPTPNDKNKKQTKDKENTSPKKQQTKVKEEKPSSKTDSGKRSPKSPDKEVVPVVVSDKQQKEKDIKGKEKVSQDNSTTKGDKSKSVTPEVKDPLKTKTDEKEVVKKPDSPKPDKTVTTKPSIGVNIDADKLQKKLSKKPSADSVLEKEDGIRTSAVSLRSDSSARNAGNHKKDTKVANGIISPTSLMGQSQGKKKDTGKYVSLEKVQPQVPEDGRTSADEKQQARRASKRPQKGQKVDFNNYENEDSGTETDREYHSRPKHPFKITSKPYLDQVHESVWRYQTRRNKSRKLNQIKRAQIHTGPMHDIVMFSRMMDNYRKGIVGEEEETVIRNYANWDGYLNDQLRFVSHLYNEEQNAETPRDVQEVAQEQHQLLASEAHHHKHDNDLRCKLIEAEQEYQRKKNQDMDKEIDTLATRTAEMFDSVKTGAASSLASAKSRNTKLRDEMRKSREERIQSATDPHERAYLQRQEIEDRMEDRHSEIDMERKERCRQWHRNKDDEMRRKLLQAYRPYFPNDVFSKKSANSGSNKPLWLPLRTTLRRRKSRVCVSGGRVKSAGRLKVDMSPSSTPGPRRTFQSPRPTSTKSGTLDTTCSSTAQFKLNNEKTQVQMTPYGLRRVRNQDRPTYEEVEAELADAIFFSPDRCTKSADAAANWSRKYDGTIRPRTSLVFVEPRVYDDLVREEKDAKSHISSKVRQSMTNGDVHHPMGLPDDTDSLAS